MAEDLTAAYAGEIDGQGELPLRVRNRLLGQIITRLPGEQERAAFIGHLGLTCAERSWGIWLSAFEAETEPMDLAREAVLSATGGPSPREGMDRLGILKASLDGKFALGENYFAAIYAGFSCWAVARDALARCTSVESVDSELSIAPEEWDACFLASLAVAGGAIWEDVGDNDSRRAFWLWYLGAAIPHALHEATSAR